MLRARQRIGKYRILGRIASGPMADVYRAYDTIQKQRVALKIPTTGSGATEEEFLHEVQVATKLRHPNILTVLNASYIDEHFDLDLTIGLVLVSRAAPVHTVREQRCAHIASERRLVLDSVVAAASVTSLPVAAAAESVQAPVSIERWKRGWSLCAAV